MLGKPIRKSWSAVAAGPAAGPVVDAGKALMLLVPKEIVPLFPVARDADVRRISNPNFIL